MQGRAINKPLMIRPLNLFVPTEITTHEPPLLALCFCYNKQSVCPSNSEPKGPSRRYDIITFTRKSIGVKVHEPLVLECDTLFIGELIDRI
jgi:hypothetical protein